MWSEERVATLRKLWAEGLSGGEIAKQLGAVSRSAVMGKVHHLGLRKRGSSRPVRSLKVKGRARRVKADSRPVIPPHKPAPKPKPAPVAPTDPAAMLAMSLLAAADAAQRRRDGYRHRGPVL